MAEGTRNRKCREDVRKAAGTRNRKCREDVRKAAMVEEEKERRCEALGLIQYRRRGFFSGLSDTSGVGVRHAKRELKPHGRKARDAKLMAPVTRGCVSQRKETEVGQCKTVMTFRWRMPARRRSDG
jgi:hypothetical protein